MSDQRTRPTVGILGAGAMGGALLRGLLSAGWPSGDVTAAVRRPDRMAALSSATGCEVSLDVARVVSGRRVIVVATKPRDVGSVLERISSVVTPAQVIVSVAAGVPIGFFEERLASGVPVVRAMPNTPALVGEGTTGIAAGRFADSDALESARTVLTAVGAVQLVDESLMDAVTAVSGTGPAYVFLLAEALTEAAIREGLSRDVAESLVHQTVRGAGHLLTETGRSPADLRGEVTSPGGTTAAAVHVLEQGGFRALLEDAVRAAAQRSRELGDTNP